MFFMSLSSCTLYEWCVRLFSFGSSSSLFPKNLSPPQFSPFTDLLCKLPKTKKKMNRCGYQQKALMGCVGVGEIRRGDISVSDGLVCPKPRLNGFFNEPIRPSRFLQINNQQTEDCDLKAGTELLDIIFAKEKYDMETPNFDMASSPPFFSGSPPSRTSNPLIQDSQFSNNNFVPIPAIPEGGAAAASAAPAPPQPARKSGGGCTPVKFGMKPAAVRIEGFNCRSSISSVA